MDALEIIQKEFDETANSYLYLAILKIQSLKQEIEILQEELRRVKLELQAVDS